MARTTPFLCAALAAASLAGCGEGIARGRIRAALVDAGLQPQPSECMAERMVDRLSMAQLRKLEALKGAGHNPLEVMWALHRIGDPELEKVTLTSAALCISGLDQPRRS